MTRPRMIGLAVAAIVVIIGAVLVVVSNGRSPSSSGGIAGDRQVTITAGGGVNLSAEVTRPRGAGRPPLIVMPAAWGQSATQYQSIARDLAGSGYLVVAYAQRGFGASGGQVDFAGTQSQADVERVVDWALRTTNADPKRIGLYGMSYGAGASLLAAAKDPRIKAVAALSTWTDLATSYDPNHTPSTRGLATLIGSGNRADATVRGLRTLLAKNPKAVGRRIAQLSPARSPMTYVDGLNRNGTAVMIANAYEDSLFGPAQLVDFYDALRTPKRLQLDAGDHGGPEAPALRGEMTAPTGSAQAWFDHYLRGADNGIEHEAPITLNDALTGVPHLLRQWPRPAARDVIALGQPGSKQQTGTARATTWSAGITAGADTAATSGPAVAPFGTYAPPTADLLTVPKELGFVWTGAAVTRPTAYGGTPVAQLGLASNKTSMTVVAYLYDISTDGTGRLMSLQPYTATGLTPNRTSAVRIALQPIAWTLPQGHRLVLVVDSQDPRYTGFNPAGARITASASPREPATLTVPALR